MHQLSVIMEVDEPQKKKNSRNRQNRNRFNNHNVRKRPAPKLPKRENDIYVNNHSQLQCQLSKCQKLFDEGHSEIIIHGLGAAISTATNVALMLQEKLAYTVDIAVHTSTVELLDNFEPLNDDEEPFSKSRSNSAIHLKVYRKPDLS